MKIRKRKTTSKKLSRAKSRYRFKAGFASTVKDNSRRTYRASKGKAFELDGSVVLRAAEFLDEETKLLAVANQLTSAMEKLPVLRITHVAKLLNVSYQTLWRWISETQQIPMPVLIDNSRGREYAVYHVEEVRIMIRTIGEHFTRFKYYRADHSATRAELFTNIDALRATNYQTSIGDTTNGNSKKRPHTRSKNKIKRTRS